MRLIATMLISPFFLWDPAVLAIRYDWQNNSDLFLHNLHDEPREIRIDPGVKDHGELPVNLLAEGHSRADQSGRHQLCSRATLIAGIAWAGFIICYAGARQMGKK